LAVRWLIKVSSIDFDHHVYHFYIQFLEKTTHITKNSTEWLKILILIVLNEGKEFFLPYMKRC
jgi:hypothetical protein